MEKEYIICSAIHYNDLKEHPNQPLKAGVVICGRRHYDCFSTLYALTNGKYNKKMIYQGFMTNEGNFVSRLAGYDIAKNANQIINDPHEFKMLYSEMLY